LFVNFRREAVLVLGVTSSSSFLGLRADLRLISPGSECEVLESLLGLESLVLRAFLQGLLVRGQAYQSMMTNADKCFNVGIKGQPKQKCTV